MTKRVMRVLIPYLPGHPGVTSGLLLKAEALANSLETQFQSVTDSLFQAAIEIFDMALRSYLITSTS